MAVDLHLGDDRNHRTRALRIGDAAPGQCGAIALGLGDGRPSHLVRSAAALTTAMSRGAFR